MRKQLLAACAALLFAGIVAAANPVVIIETSHGNIKVELNEDKAPITVKNFLKYVDDKHYDGTVFHRVISTFMIQGGGFKQGFSQAKTAADVKSLEKTTRDPIKNEGGNGLLNERGTLAMARTNNPDSATAQFFINVEKNDFLNRSQNNPGYAVFGKVIAGMDVVDKIKDVKTGEVAVFENVPLQDVVIKSIKRAN